MKNMIAAWLCLITLSILSSCQPAVPGPAEAGRAFRQQHDYENLQKLLGRLRLGMSKSEVELLLGQPDYSPIEGQYYYHTSDRVTPEGTPIGLVVDYRRTNVRTGEEIQSGKLESLWLGPIGE